MELLKVTQQPSSMTAAFRRKYYSTRSTVEHHFNYFKFDFEHLDSNLMILLNSKII